MCLVVNEMIVGKQVYTFLLQSPFSFFYLVFNITKCGALVHICTDKEKNYMDVKRLDMELYMGSE